jgi:hypothetical protein
MSQKRELSRQEFKATLDQVGPNGAWTYMRIPFDVPAFYGTRGRVSVMGTINGSEFRSSIFPDGEGGFHMMVNKNMQREAKVKPGDVVTVVMQMDVGERNITLPDDVKAAMRLNKEAQAGFAKMTPSARKEYVDWITSAKQQQTRDRRIEKAIPMIAEGKRLKS